MVGGNHELKGVPTGQRTATALLVGTVPGAEVHAAERVPRLVTTSTGCQVMCLPWQSRTRLASRDTDRTAADRQVVDHILVAMEQMMVLADPGAPLVLAAHLTASERTQRGSETDLADLFDKPVVPACELEAFPFAYGALGHLTTSSREDSRADAQRYGRLCLAHPWVRAEFGQSRNLRQCGFGGHCCSLRREGRPPAASAWEAGGSPGYRRCRSV